MATTSAGKHGEGHLYSHAFIDADQPLDSTHVELLAKVLLVNYRECLDSTSKRARQDNMLNVLDNMRL